MCKISNEMHFKAFPLEFRNEYFLTQFFLLKIHSFNKKFFSIIDESYIIVVTADYRFYTCFYIAFAVVLLLFNIYCWESDTLLAVLWLFRNENPIVI